MKIPGPANVKINLQPRTSPVVFFAHWKKNHTRFRVEFLNHVKTPMKSRYLHLALPLLRSLCWVWLSGVWWLIWVGIREQGGDLWGQFLKTCEWMPGEVAHARPLGLPVD